MVKPKNLSSLFTLLSFSLCLSTWALAADSPDAINAVRAGKIISVSGTALIRSGSSTNAKGEVMRAGTYFNANDVINTGSDGSVKLLLEDKTILDVGPSTLFHVNKFEKKGGADRQVDLAMKYGSVRAAVAKPLQGDGKFKVRTPTATMGVRGTVVGMAAGDQGTTVNLFQGRAEVVSNTASGAASKTAAPVMLIPGQSVSVTPGMKSLPPPQTLSLAQMTKQNPTVKDNTFMTGTKMPSQGKTITSGSPQSGTQVAKSEKKEDKKEEKKAAAEEKKSEDKKSEDKKSETKVAEKAPDKAPEKASEKSAESAEGSRSVASASTPVAAPAAPAVEVSSPIAATAAMVTETVNATVVATQAAPAPVISAASFIPVVNTPAVVVPAGGIKRVTIQITR